MGETTETERALAIADKLEAEWAKVCSPHTPNVSVPLTRDDLAALRHIISEAKQAERYREALTPSGETKAAYIGEFEWDACLGLDDDDDVVTTLVVPWTTTKEIMKAIRERAERPAPDTEGGA